jgi:hypothetical protein
MKIYLLILVLFVSFSVNGQDTIREKESYSIWSVLVPKANKDYNIWGISTCFSENKNQFQQIFSPKSLKAANVQSFDIVLENVYPESAFYNQRYEYNYLVNKDGFVFSYKDSNSDSTIFSKYKNGLIEQELFIDVPGEKPSIINHFYDKNRHQQINTISPDAQSSIQQIIIEDYYDEKWRLAKEFFYKKVNENYEDSLVVQIEYENFKGIVTYPKSNSKADFLYFDEQWRLIKIEDGSDIHEVIYDGQLISEYRVERFGQNYITKFVRNHDGLITKIIQTDGENFCNYLVKYKMD